MTLVRTTTTFGLTAVAVVATWSCVALADAGQTVSRTAGPERLWLAQSTGPTTEGNAGAMQMQEELVDQLKRLGIDYPAGQFMTLDQVDRLNSLFSLKEGEASTRDEAKVILGM